MKNNLANRWGVQVFRSLRHRDYRLLLGGSITASSGYWILITAQGWLVLQLTDSAFWVGLIAFMVGIPSLFLCPFGGLYADRLDRRKLMLFGQVASALPILLLATLTTTGVIAIWHIAALSVLIGTVWAFTDPAYLAIIPSLVTPSDLMNAMAMDTLAWQLSRFIGPAIAGVLMGLVAIGGTFYGAGIAFVVAFLLIFLIRTPATITTERASIWKDIKEGLSYIRSNKMALTLILMVANVSLFALPCFWLMPVFARDVLGVGEAGYTQLMMAVGAGWLAGGITAAKLGDFKRKGWLMIVSALIFTGMLILFAMSRSFPLSLVLAVIIGAANGLFQAVIIALLLSITPDQFRGRMMGLFIITWQLPSIGSLMLGAATDWVGLPVAVIAGSLICTAFILGAVLRLPALRQL
ncbi:MAG TPA: MFS transporter [Dehalococcoidia bacterium]|nr:MFS transporter [Dehalococcoidia bacterium]